MGRFASPGERILLKPNLLTGAAPEKCVTTHPSLLKAMGRLCLENNARVSFGDSPGFGSATAAAVKSGLAAAAIYTFVTSWNEVFAATILTLLHRTLPAQLMTNLTEAPLYYRYAGGFFMIIPALIFIFVIRKYLLNMWGSIVK